MTGPETGELRIETRFHSDELNQLAVPVEVRGADLSLVAQTVTGQTVGGLPRGETYVVSAQLPGGHVLTSEVRIPEAGDQPQIAVLAPPLAAPPADAGDEISRYIGNPGRTLLPGPPPPAPSWPGPAAAVVETPGPVALESLGAPTTSGPPDAAVDDLLSEYFGLGMPGSDVTVVRPPVVSRPEPAPAAGARAVVHVRLFRGNVLTASAQAQPVDELITSARHPGSLRITVPGSDRPTFLQALQAGHPAINVALPISAGRGCEVVLSTVGEGDDDAGGSHNDVSLDVHMADVEADALLRYRALGLTSEAATSVSAHDAADIPADPVAAAVKAYALLRLNRVSELDRFTGTLQDTSAWLPDGAALRGEYLARQCRHEEAIDALLRMVDRGLPLYNEGLSVAIDRLGLYLNSAEAGARSGRIPAVLALLQRFAAVTDFRKMLLRFTGWTPCTPGTDPVAALPSGAGDPTRLVVRFPLDQPSPEPPPAPSLETAMDEPAGTQATEQRFAARRGTRDRTAGRIARVRSGDLRLTQVDDPSRVALRAQRVMQQPLVKESLKGVLGRPLESLGSVEHDLVLERVLGGDNLLGVAFLELGSVVARSVGRVHLRDSMRGRGFGTAFLISPRVLLTNNHVLPDAGLAATSQVEFCYENGVDGRPRPTQMFDLMPEQLFLTNRELDFSVVAVREQSAGPSPEPLARLGFNRISRDQGKIVLGEGINIVQHPDGGLKQVALQQNELIDRLDDFLHYRTDTAPGSSGSPLYNNQWEVVGLHHSGVPKRDEQGRILTTDGAVWTSDMGETRIDWIANEGARISSIIAWLEAAAATVPGGQQRLLQDVLNPPAAVVVPEAAAAGPSGSPPPPGADEVTVSVPLQVTVRLGRVSQGAVAVDPPTPGRTGSG